MDNWKVSCYSSFMQIQCISLWRNNPEKVAYFTLNILLLHKHRVFNEVPYKIYNFVINDTNELWFEVSFSISIYMYYATKVNVPWTHWTVKITELPKVCVITLNLLLSKNLICRKSQVPFCLTFSALDLFDVWHYLFKKLKTFIWICGGWSWNKYLYFFDPAKWFEEGTANSYIQSNLPVLPALVCIPLPSMTTSKVPKFC